MSKAEQAEQALADDLPDFFQALAAQDIPLAIAVKAQCDFIEEGDFAQAVKLNETINLRLRLLAAKQKQAHANPV